MPCPAQHVASHWQARPWPSPSRRASTESKPWAVAVRACVPMGVVRTQWLAALLPARAVTHWFWWPRVHAPLPAPNAGGVHALLLQQSSINRSSTINLNHTPLPTPNAGGAHALLLQQRRTSALHAHHGGERGPTSVGWPHFLLFSLQRRGGAPHARRGGGRGPCSRGARPAALPLLTRAAPAARGCRQRAACGQAPPAELGWGGVGWRGVSLLVGCTKPNLGGSTERRAAPLMNVGEVAVGRWMNASLPAVEATTCW